MTIQDKAMFEGPVPFCPPSALTTGLGESYGDFKMPQYEERDFPKILAFVLQQSIFNVLKKKIPMVKYDKNFHAKICNTMSHDFAHFFLYSARFSHNFAYL